MNILRQKPSKNRTKLQHFIGLRKYLLVCYSIIPLSQFILAYTLITNYY